MTDTSAVVGLPKRAMVLAAGLGTRMRAFNGNIPKPLVTVGGKALIDYALDRLADAGVEQAVVNVHHLADQIERHLAHRQRPKTVISDERGELLGTGGGVLKALPRLGNDPFFHINSDTIWIDGVQPNLHRLAAAFDPARMDALLLLAATASSIGYGGRGDFSMAPDARLTRRREREWIVRSGKAGNQLTADQRADQRRHERGRSRNGEDVRTRNRHVIETIRRGSQGSSPGQATAGMQ